MALEKAVISNLDTEKDFEVLFNPKEYVLEKKTPWTEVNVFGLDSPPVQFTMGNRERLSMELFFDTSEEKTDVREYTEKIKELMVVNAQEHRPPLLRFSWGALSFDCVLEDLVQRFTLFSNDGTPLRAILKVVFKEYATAATQLSNTRRESADHTKRLTVREGETLAAVSAREYNDPSKWRVIADANDIDDPENIAAGTIIALPPLY
ncbi:MAG: LysM peptidoglycan-binding domain-containing protein [Treponema socranskii subsp. buccale]|jgi:peptidoglycan-binding lysin domain protein|uniref:CIS tube protein n=1 Tax=Treponema socranskii TaxID=53419 RepID=UPI002064DE16|nr:LysM peptidoglycan-binding domain-containing protein [Treponema socranskii]DAV37466.1 MAG TPA: LysM [Bacteriophage sp.]